MKKKFLLIVIAIVSALCLAFGIAGCNKADTPNNGGNNNDNPPAVVKQDYDMSGVSFTDKSYSYDGAEKELVITGTLPQGVSVQYSNNKRTNAGSVEVTATFTGDSVNYNPIPAKKATLTINKANYDMSGVSFTDKSYSYDGTEKELVISGTLPQGVTVQYSSNKLTNAGSVEVTATFTGDSTNYNPIAPMKATLTVVSDGSYHNVVFLLPDGERVAKVVKDGEAIADAPVVPERLGYDGVWDKDLAAIAEDCEVHASYTPIDYTITYNCGVGDNHADNPASYNIESTTITLKDPTPKYEMGYTFDGWYTDEDFASDAKITKIAAGSTGNVVVYAKWIGYCIETAENFTFDYDNYELPAITRTVSNATTLLAMSKAITVSDGCSWILSADIEGAAPIVTKNFSLNIGHNIRYITVYNTQDADYNNVYIVDIYRLDSFTYKFVNDGAVYQEEITADEATIISAPESPSKRGYTFNGWQAQGSSGVKKFPYTLMESVVFEAVYTAKTYTVTFVTDEKAQAIENITATYDQSITLPVSSKTGYTFNGWLDGDNISANTFVWQYIEDKEYIAKFTVNTYTITYNSNGGTIESTTQTVTYDSEYTLYDISKTGYTFTGYTYNGNEFTDGVYRIASNITINATWEIITYNISYELNGGTNSASNPATYTVVSSTINLANPSKAGYAFKGWFAESSFENQVTSIASGSIDDITLYAKFTVNTYTITYNKNGGTIESTTQTVTYDSEYTLYDISRTGYTFMGYTYNGNEFTDGIYRIASNITINATWQVNQYKIVYKYKDVELRNFKKSGII